ncbi:YciI family protein [Nocardioides endophyticus]|uniref:YciI family protein n=1 Tax=Nocardioides endophyticus TaxID=1353775 RepID=A0ABP8YS40_9ACTN
MAEYLIYFNQQWVGDHTEEWFRSRGPTSMAVVEEMKAAGVWIFGGGLEEEVDEAFSADATSGTLLFTDGPFAETKEYLGGFCVIRVPDDDTARVWAGKMAEGCGWPQEVRRFKPLPSTE